jgi:hypothetical protein
MKNSKQYYVVNDAYKIKSHFGFLNYSPTGKRYSSENARFSEGEVLSMILGYFSENPEKQHHRYVRDVESQLKLILTY